MGGISLSGDNDESFSLSVKDGWPSAMELVPLKLFPRSPWTSMMETKQKVMINAQTDEAFEVDVCIFRLLILAFSSVALRAAVLRRIARYELERDMFALGGRGGFLQLCLGMA